MVAENNVNRLDSEIRGKTAKAQRRKDAKKKTSLISLYASVALWFKKNSDNAGIVSSQSPYDVESLSDSPIQTEYQNRVSPFFGQCTTLFTFAKGRIRLSACDVRSIIFLIVLYFIMQNLSAQDVPPTLEDFWDGDAEWVLDIEDVGLPVGESDTIQISDSEFWSYLHASDQSAGVIDQCGEPVAFPGCMTRWQSDDGGASFTLPTAVCSMTCETCPCDDQRDHVGLNANGIPQAAQQYPRVAIADDGTFYMAYEWHAQTILRTSADGLVWSDWSYLTTPGGTWPSSVFTCSETEKIGAHPNIRGEIYDCLVGAPPGIYVEGDMLYVFVAAGSAPANMRCYKGDRHGDLSQLQICENDPLFSGAQTYGDVDVLGAEANQYFDFRYISSADMLKVGDHYYMSYEGIRGPEELEIGMDTQFGLGFARSVSNQIDGAWEKFSGNPVIMDMTFNWGIGHADMIVIDGVTYLYSATSQETRGRYRLDWVD